MEVTFARGGDKAYVGREGGGGKTQGQIRIEVDGYSAPLTAGNFVANVTAGAYDGSQLAIGGETVSVASTKLPGESRTAVILASGTFLAIWMTVFSEEAERGGGNTGPKHTSARESKARDCRIDNFVLTYREQTSTSG